LAPFLCRNFASVAARCPTACSHDSHLQLLPDNDQLHRSTKEVKLTPAAQADKLMQILRSYPLETGSTEAKAGPVQLRPLDTAPEIILSESFAWPGQEGAAGSKT
jgi:hypothetical protein